MKLNPISQWLSILFNNIVEYAVNFSNFFLFCSAEHKFDFIDQILTSFKSMLAPVSTLEFFSTTVVWLHFRYMVEWGKFVHPFFKAVIFFSIYREQHTSRLATLFFLCWMMVDEHITLL